MVLNLHLFTQNIATIQIFLVFLSYINEILYLCTHIHYNIAYNMANTTLCIKELCRDKGITQAQLAERIGIKPVSFSQAISRNNFDIQYLSRIADALGVEIPDLFQQSNKGVNGVCPHCGKPIKITITSE